MVITHRQITVNEVGACGSLLLSNQTDAAAASFYDSNKKHLGRKLTSKQLFYKSVAVAVVAAVAFLGVLTPALLWYFHGTSSSRRLRHPIKFNVDDPVPRPKDWKLWGYHDFRKNFNCYGYLNDGTKPLPTMEYWDTMLKVYNQVVDPTYKFDADVPPTQGYRLDEGRAQPQPYYAKLSPGKGRGLFASRDIQKGEIVHDGTKSDVVFPDGLSWKRFMFALPRKMACDQSEWTFTQQFEEYGPMRVVSSLNIAILMNEGNTMKDVNVRPEDGNGEPSEYSAVFYAMRNIKKDEEILMNYADYDTDYNAAGIGPQVQQSKLDVVQT